MCCDFYALTYSTHGIHVIRRIDTASTVYGVAHGTWIDTVGQNTNMNKKVYIQKMICSFNGIYFNRIYSYAEGFYTVFRFVMDSNNSYHLFFYSRSFFVITFYVKIVHGELRLRLKLWACF